MNRFVAATMIGIGVAATGLSSSGAAEPPIRFEKEIRPLLAKYCFSCHGDKKTEAEVNLVGFANEESVLKAQKLWKRVWSAVRTYEMPLEKHPQPSGAERLLVIRWVESVLSRPNPSGARDPGPLVIRRLNRTEYINTVKDLLGGSPPSPYFNPRQGSLPEGVRLLFHERITNPNTWDLPADDVVEGFDNIGEALSVPPLLMEKYLLASREMLDQAEKGRPALLGGPAPQAISNFAARAFRRPVKPEEVQPYLNLYERAVRDGESNPSALKLAIQAMLVSPNFLFRVEGRGDQQWRAGSVSDRSTGVRPVSDHELATRLSYFLWSTTPDDELLRLAAQGSLHNAEVLEAQVRRMLKSHKAKALSENFFIQWLGIRDIQGAMPNPMLFPDFYNKKYFQAVMKQEALMLCEAIMIEDRSVLDLIDPDFAYLNSMLAEYYGIKPKVSGQGAHAFWHRYQLEDKRRGGVQTMAAVLTMTSGPTRTNIPRRGKWVLEKILGAPPPPPPPVVPELDEKATAGLPLRKLLEVHRSNEACASCHRQMDAIGLSLENYDAIGRWREQANGQPIDASTELPDGTKFSGPIEFKRVLRARKDDFVRCLAGHLLTYGLGRRVDFCDAQALHEITQAVAADDCKFSRLVIEIVQSYPFRNRRTSEVKP